MLRTDPFADCTDVADVWRPIADNEVDRVSRLIQKASIKLRQACPFDIDARITLWETDPTNYLALDPYVVADVVATVVKRFLVNQEGAATVSDGVGPYSHSATYVNRYDKTGSDVRGALQVIDSDVDQLRPATRTRLPGSVQLVPTAAMRPPLGYLPAPRLGTIGGILVDTSPYQADIPLDGYLEDDVITDPSIDPPVVTTPLVVLPEQVA